MKFNVFGRSVQVVKGNPGWRVYYYSGDGKRRQATDIVIPAGVKEEQVERYLADLCHEWASEREPDVRRTD